MPRGRGGPRTPRNPAPVSGPGAMSQRTDGGPGKVTGSTPAPSQGYGEGVARQAIQSGAPVAPGATGGPTTNASGQGPPPMGDMRGQLFAESDRPGEPLTAGVGMGPGANSPELLPQDADTLLRAAYQLYPDPNLLRFMTSYHA